MDFLYGKINIRCPDESIKLSAVILINLFMAIA